MCSPHRAVVTRGATPGAALDFPGERFASRPYLLSARPAPSGPVAPIAVRLRMIPSMTASFWLGLTLAGFFVSPGSAEPSERHASRHPAEASFYAEIPRVAVALEAYRDAPLLRLLSERRLLDPIEALIGEGGFSEWVGEPLGSELSRGAVGLMDRLDPWTEGLNAVSFSLRPAQSAEGALGGLHLRAALEFAGAESLAAWLARVGVTSAPESPDGPESATSPVKLPDEITAWLPFDVPDLYLLRAEQWLVLDSESPPGHTPADPVSHGPEHPATALAELPGAEGVEFLRLWQTQSPLEGWLDGADPSGMLATLIGMVLGPEGAGALRLHLGPRGFERRTRSLGPAPSWRGPGELNPATFTALPDTTAFVLAARIEPKALGESLPAWGSWLRAADLGEDLERFLESPAGRTALDAFLGQLGPEVVLYAQPITGIQVRLLAQAELRDAAAAARALENLLGAFAAASPERWTMRNRPYRRQPYLTLETAPPEGPAGMFLGSEWVFGISGQRLIVGLPTAAASNAVKAEMRRLDGRTPPRHPLALEGAWPEEGSSLLAEIDWPGTLGGLLDSARTLAGFAAGQTGGALPFDPSRLPPGSVFADHLGPTRLTVHGHRERTDLVSRSSFGPETLLLLAGLGVGFVFEPGDSSVAIGDSLSSDPLADLETDEHGRTLAALVRVRDALNLHAAFHGGRYPENLEVLASPSERFPDGLFAGRGVPLDGWGRPLRYRVDDRSASYALWSVGPDGIDQAGSGDDVSL